MRVGSLFSGIGGLELGLERAGLGPVIWQVEKDPFCRHVLQRHWPDAERFDDVCSAGAVPWRNVLRPVDIICGGFPCQDVSSAGKGKGLAGERSGLWREFDRIVGELRPRWVVVENVASGATRWFDIVVRDLEKQGYGVLPIPLSAFDVGAPHLRRRVFIVAHANGQRRDSRWQLESAQAQRARVGGAGAPCVTANSTSIGRGKPVESQPHVQRDGCEPAQLLNPKRSAAGEMESGSVAAPSWPAPPELRGVDDGIPDRIHRLRALGNAVVPDCAEVVGWVIRELEAA